MAVAKYLYVRFNLEQTFFRRRKLITSGQEIARDGLSVASQEWTAWPKRLAEIIVRRRRLRGAMYTSRAEARRPASIPISH
jgi:hypothetical protein